MFSTIESLEFLHRGEAVSLEEEMKSMGGLSKVMFLGGTLFNLYLCLLCDAGDWVMENMGETRFLHLTVFGCAHGYSLHLPTYSLCALGSGHAEFSASQNIRVGHSPTSKHSFVSCLTRKHLYSISM